MAHHHEVHRMHRAGWLRAAVLGANDGIISIASLLVGVVAAGSPLESCVMIGFTALVAGAVSMAAGEYISVSSQADMERADLLRESQEIAANPVGEHRELTQIYRQRGLTAELANQVADQLMAHDALEAHARDELGITLNLRARPLQAAGASALAFLLGGVLPLLGLWCFPVAQLDWLLGASSLACLALLGGIAAYLGRAPLVASMVRVSVWGALAMATTFVLGGVLAV